MRLLRALSLRVPLVGYLKGEQGYNCPLKIWKQIESIYLNLESSLAARLEIADSVDLLICFDSFHIMERSPLILLLVLGESRDYGCLLYTSPSPRDRQKSRMPSSA